MPRIIRELDLSQGHCWNPTIPEIVINTTVFSVGRRVVAVGDTYNSILHMGCTIPPTTHNINVVIGSTDVFIQNRPVLRDGDLLSCGDVANALEGNVFVNGGGLGGPAAAQTGDPGQTTGYTIQGPPVLDYPIRTIVIYGYAERSYPEFRLCSNQDYVDLLADAYTPIKEEYTGQIYKNYPGPPVSQTRGANLPYYAPESARNPIPIGNFRIIEGTPPQGIEVSPESGRIYGVPTYIFSDSFVIQCENDFRGSIHQSNTVRIDVVTRTFPNSRSCP